MKIAIIHDWFVSVGGAEKVTKHLLKVFPDADVFCAFDFFDDKKREEILSGKKTKSTYLKRLPYAKKNYRYYVPFFFKAMESLDLKEYDLLISSSHSIAKGVIKHDNQMHICYCHTPVRYAWDMRKTYISRIPKPYRKNASKQLNRLREWDRENSKNVDFFVSNSDYIKERIKNNYNREALTIHPPVDTDYYNLPIEKIDNDSYLIVSRLVHYKNVELIINAFTMMPDKKLIIIGDGPQKEFFKSIITNNIKILGFLPKNEVKSYMQNSKAMILSAIEDFGITTVECQSCGTPVIALKHGGYLETVKENVSGVFYQSNTKENLIDAVQRFESITGLNPNLIRENALRFDKKIFQQKMKSFVNEKTGHDS